MQTWRVLKGFFLVTFFVTGCTTVATSSVQAVYSHQSIQKSATDQYLTMRAYQAIDIDSDHFKNANINISTFNRVVLLSGQAPTFEQKAEAEQLVKQLEGVGRVYNLITIEKPASQWARLRDVWITAKIKAKLIISNDLDASQVKVVTENQTVFLMGILRPSEARAAVKVASKTEGVQGVVKIFSYLNLSKTPLEG